MPDFPSGVGGRFLQEGPPNLRVDFNGAVRPTGAHRVEVHPYGLLSLVAVPVHDFHVDPNGARVGCRLAEILLDAMVLPVHFLPRSDWGSRLGAEP
jgi:hypothetical protein